MRADLDALVTALYVWVDDVLPKRSGAGRRPKLTDAGRITARRLMRIVRAAGYEGSERSLRRAVAEAKAAWRERRRSRSPSA